MNRVSFTLVLLFLLVISPLHLMAENLHAFTPHYIIAVDNSGSMKHNGSSEGVKKLLNSFIENLKTGNKVTLVTFGSENSVVFNGNINNDEGLDTLKSKAESIKYDGSYTDIKGGFDFVLDFLAMKELNEVQPFVIFLTDGELDLVSRKNATFPEEIMGNNDFSELLTEYKPYIRGNSIERTSLEEFNKRINQQGGELVRRDIIPKLKNEVTPLFILSFSLE
ncbi:MAG: VWA domain-containing protein, partial [Nitrospinae bacterium]|nr:VWA domain-containing protein [Nitrospinota bacterium]